jgi:aconitate hydratase
MSENSFGAKDTLDVGGQRYEIFRLDALQQRFDVARLPFSLKVLLENLLRTEGNGSVSAADIEALAGWDAEAQPSREIAFSPARVLMQDFTGVPAVVDLAAMRWPRWAATRPRSTRSCPPSSSSTTRCRSMCSARAMPFA